MFRPMFRPMFGPVSGPGSDRGRRALGDLGQELGVALGGLDLVHQQLEAGRRAALAADGSAAPGLELLIDKIRSTKSNDEFLAEIAKGPAV